MPEKTTVINAPVRAWRFQLAGSEKVWTLPLMGSLPIGTARRMMRLADVETESEMIEAACTIFDELCPGLIDTVTSDQLLAIMRGWQEASGMTPGESQASSGK